MPIKTILLPLGEKDRDEALLAEAESLLPYATIGLSESMRASVREAAEKQHTEATKRLQQVVDKACVRSGVSMARRGDHPGKVSADWLVTTGSQTDLVARYGRLADLIVVPRPVQVSPPPRTIDAALRESGRPVRRPPKPSPPPALSCAKPAP
jgi:hypothetical protein